MTMVGSWLLAVPVILGLAVCGWIISVVRRDVSIVDSLWSLFFLVAVAVFWYGAAEVPLRGVLVTTLVAIWALRLSIHIAVRNFGEDEDRRYQAIRQKYEPGFVWKSLFIVFGFQAFLAWVIALPLLFAVRVPAAPGVVDAVAVILWSVGFFFEAVGDAQLRRFRQDPANRGRVLQTGLWRYTRHPNYFGEACMWWSFWLFAVPGGGWWTVFSPILMTVLLLRVSGVTLLEKDMNRRRPAYENYVRRTNAFVPGPPRKGDAR